ncbi:S1 family peptidase [Sinorhizobium meliloti]|uniref:S1 family peptidase n=1 Tax=Rhizobium meliloti TaxID=382 RepID=UPI000FD81322|nr:serine protease [Sinorhizobium meliloti]RVN99992.1 serine protease [Sinorhizobium meliloti]
MYDQLPHITSRIETLTPAGIQSVGTGFFFGFDLGDNESLVLLLTNKHVVDGANRARIYLSRANGNEPAFGAINAWEITEFDQLVVRHPNPSVDLAAFPVGGVLNDMSRAGTPAYFRSLGLNNIPTDEQAEQLTAIEEILMIGYPIGVWDETNNLPIVRRGITATPYARDYNGAPEFMIDCACFPGSSGSPVMIANNGSFPRKDGSIAIGSRFHLLGLLWGGPQYTAQGNIVARPVPTAMAPVAMSQIPTNLGFCVKSRMIRDLEPMVRARYGN